MSSQLFSPQKSIFRLPESATRDRGRGSLAPDSLRVKLVYAESVTLVSASASGTYTFLGNDLYDPNFSGTGHQPRGFDQYSALYNRFRVLGSKIEIFPETQSSTVRAMVSVIPSNIAMSISGMHSALEAPLVKQTLPFNVYTSNVGLAHAASTSEILGIPEAQVWSADRVQSTIAASPADPWLWYIVAGSVDELSNVTVDALVKITYDAVFFDRRIPSQSLVKEVELKEYKAKGEREDFVNVPRSLEPDKPKADTKGVPLPTPRQGFPPKLLRT